MSTKRRSKLQVVVLGGGHYIEVPKSESADLLSYLRSRCVPSSPPQTHTSDTDCIELGRGQDIKRVQSLLDQWS
jgi:hypothetical protein